MKKFVFFLIAVFAVLFTALIGNPLETLQVGVFSMATLATFIPLVGGMNSQNALKEAREKAQKLAVDMRGLNDLAVSEKRSLTDDEDQEWNRMEADLTNTEKEIRRLLTAIEIEARHGQIDEQRHNQSKGNESRDESTQKYSAAFKNWLMRGMGGLDEESRAMLSAEYRDLSVGTAADGGYTVPEGFMNKLEAAMLAFGGIFSVAAKLSTATGNDIPFPVVNDTANKGAIIGENTSVGTSVDPTFGSITIKSFTYSSKPILVSNILLQDSAFGLENFLVNAMAERIWKAFEEHLATGNGTTQPHGIVTAAANSSISGVGATAITFDNLIDLMHSVDPNYRKNGTWLFNDNTLKALRKIKDSESKPIWQGNYTDNNPSTILGRPYQVSTNIADIGASAKSVLFGDMSKYMVREVAGAAVKRLVERYADYNQTGYLLFKRFDARLIDAGTNPVKYLAHAAS